MSRIDTDVSKQKTRLFFGSLSISKLLDLHNYKITNFDIISDDLPYQPLTHGVIQVSFRYLNIFQLNLHHTPAPLFLAAYVLPWVSGTSKRQ